jgi:hypothetical protein
MLGYFSLIICSFIGFFGGRILPAGLGIIFFPFIIELGITIFYIVKSIINRKLHFQCFSILIFIIAVFLGLGLDIYDTEKTKRYLLSTDAMIEEYRIRNGLQYLGEEDFNNIILPKGIRVYFHEDGYELRYKDGMLINR